MRKKNNRPFFYDAWARELDSHVPQLNENVKNASIPQKEAPRVTFLEKITALFAKPSFYAKAACAAVAVLLIVVLLIPGAGDTPDPVVPETSPYLVRVDVNPGVVFVVSAEDVIVGATAINEDADVILTSEEFSSAVRGATLENGLVSYMALCSSLGYIDPEGDAVRISGTEGVEIDGAKVAVEDYFKDNGIMSLVAVGYNKASEYAELLGVDSKLGISELVNEVKKLPELFCEKEIAGATGEKLEEIYQDVIESEDSLDILRRFVDDNLDKLADAAERLEKLNALSLSIKLHRDPHHPFKNADYWGLIGKSEELHGELAEKVEEMTRLLNEYKSLYGVEISSSEELAARAGVLTKGLVDGLRVVGALGDELLVKEREVILFALSYIGAEVDWLNGLFEAPSNAEELLELKKELAKKNFDAKKEDHAGKDDKRESIDDSSYSDFISAVIKEYGSVEKYFESLSKRGK